jgi:Ca-activated chloride channel family protein
MKNYDILWLLFIAGFVLVPVYVWAFWRKSRALSAFASSPLLKLINPATSVSRQIFKAFLLILGFCVIVIALARPIWNPHSKDVKSKGRDVVILLDTSRSMLAEDIKPNRLERARIAIADLLNSLEGDRIGMVTFAGSSSIKCPLTVDYGFMRMALADITTESSGMGGTKIGDAIRKATDEVFDQNDQHYKDIILITDGEDQESFPVEAARAAAENGARIIAIGLGDAEQGTMIPVVDERGRKSFLKYEGEFVRSKLDEKTLLEVATASLDGRYLPVRTGTFDLDEVYKNIVSSAKKRDLESASMIEYDEKFQIFLAIGIVLIFCEALISERKKN